MTSGGVKGVESEVAETGRCSILELCCRGRETGGPAVLGLCDTRTVPVVDHGEDVRGMSSEARILPSWARSDLVGGLEGKSVEGVVGLGLVLDLSSNKDLRDDTGFCQ